MSFDQTECLFGCCGGRPSPLVGFRRAHRELEHVQGGLHDTYGRPCWLQCFAGIARVVTMSATTANPRARRLFKGGNKVICEGGEPRWRSPSSASAGGAGQPVECCGVALRDLPLLPV